MTDELLVPKKRGRPKKEEPVLEPPVGIDDPNYIEQIEREESGRDNESEAEMEAIVRQMADAEADQKFAESIASVEELTPTKPDRRRFITTDGGLYLPVRQRIVWMRGEPIPHPEWGVRTEIVHLEPGTVQGTKTVYFGSSPKDVLNISGGCAIVHAMVLDQNGMVIAEGTAMERSEGFFDFVEKAETAAIGRALAVAGYGTENAIDLDEGEDNLADAPVKPNLTVLPPPNGEIKIEASTLPQPKQGGRQQKATQPQLQAIRDAAREKMLSPSGLQTIAYEALGRPDDPFFEDEVTDDANGSNDILGYLANLSFVDCGKVVLAVVNG